MVLTTPVHYKEVPFKKKRMKCLIKTGKFRIGFSYAGSAIRSGSSSLLVYST